eukprot:1151486-Pelagomonas_calceolata.AAC.1
MASSFGQIPLYMKPILTISYNNRSQLHDCCLHGLQSNHRMFTCCICLFHSLNVSSLLITCWVPFIITLLSRMRTFVPVLSLSLHPLVAALVPMLPSQQLFGAPMLLAKQLLGAANAALSAASQCC